MTDQSIEQKTPEQMAALEAMRKAFGLKGYYLLGFLEDRCIISADITPGNGKNNTVALEDIIQGADALRGVITADVVKIHFKGMTVKGEIHEKGKDGHTHITRFEKNL